MLWPSPTTTVSPTGVPAASSALFDWCSISAGDGAVVDGVPGGLQLGGQLVLGAEQDGVAEHGDRLPAVGPASDVVGERRR